MAARAGRLCADASRDPPAEAADRRPQLQDGRRGAGDHGRTRCRSICARSTRSCRSTPRRKRSPRRCVTACSNSCGQKNRRPRLVSNPLLLCVTISTYPRGDGLTAHGASCADETATSDRAHGRSPRRGRFDARFRGHAHLDGRGSGQPVDHASELAGQCRAGRGRYPGFPVRRPADGQRERLSERHAVPEHQFSATYNITGNRVLDRPASGLWGGGSPSRSSATSRPAAASRTLFVGVRIPAILLTTGVISGPLPVQKDGVGTWNISGPSPNTYRSHPGDRGHAGVEQARRCHCRARGTVHRDEQGLADADIVDWSPIARSWGRSKSGRAGCSISTNTPTRSAP